MSQTKHLPQGMANHIGKCLMEEMMKLGENFAPACFLLILYLFEGMDALRGCNNQPLISPCGSCSVKAFVLIDHNFQA